MKICIRCNGSKPAKEFPYAANHVCFDCHRQNAMNWDKLPYADQPVTDKQRKARTESAKKLNSTPVLPYQIA